MEKLEEEKEEESFKGPRRRRQKRKTKKKVMKTVTKAPAAVMNQQSIKINNNTNKTHQKIKLVFNQYRYVLCLFKLPTSVKTDT